MRRTVIRVVAAAFTLSAGILYGGGTVSAHTPGYSLSCEGATIRGQGYEDHHTNLAEIHIDDVVVLHIDDFGTNVEETVAIPQDARSALRAVRHQRLRGDGAPVNGR